MLNNFKCALDDFSYFFLIKKCFLLGRALIFSSRCFTISNESFLSEMTGALSVHSVGLSISDMFTNLPTKYPKQHTECNNVQFYFKTTRNKKKRRK